MRVHECDEFDWMLVIYKTRVSDGNSFSKCIAALATSHGLKYAEAKKARMWERGGLMVSAPDTVCIKPWPGTLCCVLGQDT